MPFYDYACAACGPFTEARPLAAFADPCPCPDCGSSAPRTLTAPALGAGTAKGAEPSAAASPFSRHPGGCGCCAAPSRRVATAVS
jgi:putative FmdB family regulatory protein